jgi:hypothetical protein
MSRSSFILLAAAGGAASFYLQVRKRCIIITEFFNVRSRNFSKETPMIEERRVCERYNLSTKAHLLLNDEIIEGEVRNISVSGAFVAIARLLEMNTEVELSIDNPLTHHLNFLKAKVARVADNGVGLHFASPL